MCTYLLSIQFIQSSIQLEYNFRNPKEKCLLVLYPQCLQHFLTQYGYWIYICETNICPWKQSPLLEECVEEGKVLFSDRMGQGQVENPYQGNMGRDGDQESRLGSGRPAKGRPQCKESKTLSACPCLILKELVRNLLRNNCLQKWKLVLRKQKNPGSGAEKPRSRRRRCLEWNKSLRKWNDPSFECKCYVKAWSPLTSAQPLVALLWPTTSHLESWGRKRRME